MNNIRTQSPTSFKGGTLWNVVSSIHGALQAIGYALLVLFFVIGVMKTCSSLTEVKRPEHALRLFVRFALAKGVISYGMDLMLALLDIVQGVISTIMQAAGFGQPPFHCPPLPGNPPRASARAFSKATLPSAWKGQSSFWPA